VAAVMGTELSAAFCVQKIYVELLGGWKYTSTVRPRFGDGDIFWTRRQSSASRAPRPRPCQPCCCLLQDPAFCLRFTLFSFVAHALELSSSPVFLPSSPELFFQATMPEIPNLDSPSPTVSRQATLRLPTTCDPPSERNPPKQAVWVVSNPSLLPTHPLPPDTHFTVLTRGSHGSR
jgi:hypothetical protein